VHNTQALALVAADILALLQVYGGVDAASLPRSVHSTILRVLRPAESALRRLIVIAARDLVIEPGEKSSPAQATGPRRSPRKPASSMSFQLVDPRKRFNAPRVTYTTLAPRIFFIAPAAPFSPLSPQPQALPDRAPIPESSDRHIGARRLSLRLKAFTSALEDIPRHAKRLLHWRLRREAQQPPRYYSPLRPGNPPGHRTRPWHEVDDILRQCHKYALGVLSEATATGPNTS
jgi:hypothetical protein